MSDRSGLRERTFTHEELDGLIVSLFNVGGLYELIAQWVEHNERPPCTGEPSGRRMPWD